MSTTTHLQELVTARATHFPANGNNGAFTVVELRDADRNKVSAFIKDVAAADELIKAAVAAKDLLLAAQVPAGAGVS